MGAHLHVLIVKVAHAGSVRVIGCVSPRSGPVGLVNHGLHYSPSSVDKPESGGKKELVKIVVIMNI